MYTNTEKKILALGLVFILVFFIWHNSLIVSGEYHSYCGNLVNVANEFTVKRSNVKSDLRRMLESAVVSDNIKRKWRAEREKDLERIREEIEEETRLGEMELLAQLIEAEAGNQDYIGKCLVADVVLNRRDADWGENIEEVIFADYQFSCIFDGGFDRAAWHISDESFKAAKQEYEAAKRIDNKVLYFTAGGWGKYGTPAFIHGDHYFCY